MLKCFMRLVIVLVSLTAASALALASVVHVQADNEAGQGITLWQNDECLVLTADHVVRDSLLDGPPITARTITLTGPRNAKGRAEWRDAFPGDVALLRVVGNRDALCGEGEARVIAAQEGVVVPQRKADGSLTFLPVRISKVSPSGEFLTIVPGAGQDALRTGLSGSAVFDDGLFFGMLTTVDSDSGEGQVLQEEFIGQRIGEYSFIRNEQPTQCSDPAAREYFIDRGYYDLAFEQETEGSCIFTGYRQYGRTRIQKKRLIYIKPEGGRRARSRKTILCDTRTSDGPC